MQIRYSPATVTSDDADNLPLRTSEKASAEEDLEVRGLIQQAAAPSSREVWWAFFVATTPPFQRWGLCQHTIRGLG